MRHSRLRLRKTWVWSALLAAVLLGVGAQSVFAHGSSVRYYTNVRKVVNQHDNRLRARGRVQLNFPGEHAAVLDDEAWAYSSCENCQSLAIALQVNMISPESPGDTLIAKATAINYQCTGCTTIAVAMTYNVVTEDYHDVPKSVKQLIHQMNREIGDINEDRMTLNQALTQLNTVIAQFQSIKLPGPDPKAQPHAAATLAPASALPSGLVVKWDTATESTTAGATAQAAEQ